MTDSFNPHEILSRLRSNGKLTSGNSVGASVGGATVSLPLGSVQNSAPQSHQSAQPSAAKEKFVKAAKSVSATLALSNPQEGNPIRSELEKELKKLQEEISSLKAQNKQLQSDKEDVERQFIEFKIKSEDVVTKLRGKIASLTLGQRGSIDGPGKVYPPPPPHQAQNEGRITKAAQRTKLTANSPPPALGPTLTYSAMTGHVQTVEHAGYGYQAAEGFREPTFSELMRRSTPEHSDFHESLRRSGNIKGSVAKPLPSVSMANKSLHSSHDTPYNAGAHHSTVDQYDYYSNTGAGLNMNMNLGMSMGGSLGMPNLSGSGNMNVAPYPSLGSSMGSNGQGGPSGYIHPSFNHDMVPEFDHSLPIVEIDLSKQ